MKNYIFLTIFIMVSTYLFMSNLILKDELDRKNKVIEELQAFNHKKAILQEQIQRKKDELKELDDNEELNQNALDVINFINRMHKQSSGGQATVTR